MIITKPKEEKILKEAASISVKILSQLSDEIRKVLRL
jgi:hypothetical protein